MDERKRSQIERDVDREIREKGVKAHEDFDPNQSIRVPARKRESKLISIRIPVEMMKELRRVAEQNGSPGYQRVIKKYISEGLIRDLQSAQKNKTVDARFFVYQSVPTSSNQMTKSFFWPVENAAQIVKEDSAGGIYK